MSLEGLWTSEFYGLHGWENTGIAVLRDGHVLGGGRHHHSIGTYTVSGNEVTLSLQINYHGKPRVLFGSSERRLNLQLTGELAGTTIEGDVCRAESPRQSLIFRLTKRADIP